MRKRNICQFVTMFLLGMGWRIFHHIVCFMGAIAVLAILLWNMHLHHINKAARGCLICVLVMFFILGAWHGESEQKQRLQLYSFLQGADEVSFQGEIIKKEITSDKIVYYLQNVYLQKDGEQIRCPSVLLYPKSDNDSIGTIYIGKADIMPFRQSRNEGNFDEKAYYESNEVYAKLINPVIQKRFFPENAFLQKLYELRVELCDVFEALLPGEESGVMSTIALGEKASLELEAKELYRMAGLSHILAISGLHISVVGMSIYKLLRRLGLRYLTAGGASAAIVFTYALMCGMSNSVKRAVLMYVLLLFANVVGRAYDSLTALAFVAFVMFGSHPIYLQNTGCIFSFLSVFGVVTIGKRCSSLGMAFGIQLFTFPLIAYFFYEIPLYSVFINMLLLPFLGILLGMGLLGAFAGMQHMFLAKGMLLPCHIILYGYEWLAAVSLRLPGAKQIVGCPSLWRIGIYYVLLYLAIYGMKQRAARAVTIVAAIFLLVVPGPHKLEVDVLDVGQGDGIFVESDAGNTFFIDGGSTDVKAVGKYRILPFLKYKGIREIDYWFVSHTDEDHVNGLLECMQNGYPIKHLVFSKYVVKNENYQMLVAEAKKQGIAVEYMSPGMCCKTKGLTFRCLYPPASVSEDTNAMSLTLLMEAEGMRALFTGDLAAEQERELAMQEIGRVDLLKASHHGSDFSSATELLSEILPQYTVVSCAAKNRYGHPGEEAIRRLEESGSTLYYTMNMGQIKLVRKKNHVLEICTERRNKEELFLE